MDIQTLRTFFMWCTIINAGLLALSFLIFIVARNGIYRMHSKWFPISQEAFNVAIYSSLGLLKLLFLVFNLVPYIALLILG